MEKKDRKVVGEDSKRLKAFKEKNGLPSWQEIQKDEKMGLMDQIEIKLRRMARFSELNKQLMTMMHSAGWDVSNVFHNVVDLQNKLLEYEEKLAGEGRNPLEEKEYMDARKQLMQEIQFIHKHKLALDEFQHRVTKKPKNEDDLFDVE